MSPSRVGRGLRSPPFVLDMEIIFNVLDKARQRFCYKTYSDLLNECIIVVITIIIQEWHAIHAVENKEPG